MLNLAAIDLGADSGRLVLGRFDGERVRTEELHRFASHPVRLPTGLHIDVAHIWREIGVGLQAVAAPDTLLAPIPRAQGPGATHANEQRPCDGRFKTNGLFATFGGV
jgi:hypothetical protein